MTCVVQNPEGMTWLRTDQKSNGPVFAWTESGGSTDASLYTVTRTVVGTTTTYELTVSLRHNVKFNISKSNHHLFAIKVIEVPTILYRYSRFDRRRFKYKIVVPKISVL